MITNPPIEVNVSLISTLAKDVLYWKERCLNAEGKLIDNDQLNNKGGYTKNDRRTNHKTNNWDLG